MFGSIWNVIFFFLAFFHLGSVSGSLIEDIKKYRIFLCIFGVIPSGLFTYYFLSNPQYLSNFMVLGWFSISAFFSGCFIGSIIEKSKTRTIASMGLFIIFTIFISINLTRGL